MTQNGIPNAQHGQRRRRFANRYQARLPGDYNITNYPRATRCGSPHSRFSAVARFQSCWIPKGRTKDDAAHQPSRPGHKKKPSEPDGLRGRRQSALHRRIVPQLPHRRPPHPPPASAASLRKARQFLRKRIVGTAIMYADARRQIQPAAMQ